MSELWRHSRGRGLVRSFIRFLSILPAMLALSCGEPGRRVANERPFVKLTGGPAPGERVDYRATFFWHGWDRDGVVDHYQVAVDIPDSLVAGALEGREDPRIAWIDTTATEVTILFSTPHPDTAGRSGWVILLAAEPPEYYLGGHTLHVRSVDNEGAVSRADYVSFTAQNIVPRTTIDLFCLGAEGYRVGRRVLVRWRGVDPENPVVGHRLDGCYEWKLIPGVDPSLTDPQSAIMVSPGPAYPWNRVASDVDSVDLTLDPPQWYLFAVRGIDEAGAVEDRFVLGRNAVLLRSVEGLGLPELTITEPLLGSSFTFPRDGEIAEFELLAGYCVRIEFTGTFLNYCASIKEFDWGLDVADPGGEGPGSGFRGWSFVPYTEQLCFDSPGVHTLIVRVRDDLGQRVTGIILLRVVGIPRDRAVLYVDDFRLARSSLGVSDEMMDARARAMLVAAGYPEQEVHQSDTFDPGDFSIVPTALRLADLGRYRLVLWSNFGAGYRGMTGLVAANACPAGRVLRAYLDAGGVVWVYGQMLFGSFKRYPNSADCMASLAYDDEEGLNFGPGEFVTDYLHIEGGDFRDAQLTKVNGLVRGHATAVAEAELFPPVEIDSTVFDAVKRGGLPFVDAMFEPTPVTGLDVLYALETPDSSSAFRDKPIAFRCFDPDPASKRGPLAVFGFPFHLLKQGSAAERTGVQGMARAMVEWFRAHGAG